MVDLFHRCFVFKSLSYLEWFNVFYSKLNGASFKIMKHAAFISALKSDNMQRSMKLILDFTSCTKYEIIKK